MRKAERAHEELLAQLGAAEVARSELAIRVREFEAAAAARPTPSGRRPLVSPWAMLALACGLLALALALVVRRRGRLEPAVPDPIVAANPTSANAEPKVPVG